ncbi:hypothetical protein [Geothrix sp. 21YS21S-2]|uniref:hypothetical protein n=1 Tax=Geothrix sp. 21YS21S-2 TaxID=3068893 RepID=UPI0027BA0980|nr:hypothetical protein [Geothrix sp. 21YS21S-2]
MPRTAILCFCLLALACRSPLATLKAVEGGPSIRLARVSVEDHSRQLKRLKRQGPEEANTPEARRKALDDHGLWLESTFREEAAACGIAVRPDAPYRLELVVTDLGEIRTTYILYGIASGVAWGVGTGLLVHNTRLAVGLGGYELLEESAFWIGGSALFGSFSAPAVLEARLFAPGDVKPFWTETYYVLSGRSLIRELPEPARADRAIQLRASLQKAILKLLEDLEAIPGFPARTRDHLTGGPASFIRQALVPEKPPAQPPAP